MKKSKKMRQIEAIERTKKQKEVREERPCSLCKTHENNPSFCRKYLKYVGRKDTCTSFRLA